MPWWKKARYGVEYLAFRFVGLVFGTLPVETSSAFCGWLWRHIAPWNKRHARALDHLRQAFPEKSEAERETIARNMWENLGRVFAESFHLKRIADSDRIFIEPYDQVKAASTSGKPVVVCAPHMGNWELVVLGLTRPGMRPTGIYKRIKNPFVDAYAFRHRTEFYPGGLLAKELSTPKRLMRIARDGGAVAFLADLRERGGLEVPFFGRPAASVAFPMLIARTYGASLYAGYLLREPKVRFRAYWEEIPVAQTADKQADIAAATAAVHAAFERFIRRAPEQWMWAHRRWG